MEADIIKRKEKKEVYARQELYTKDLGIYWVVSFDFAQS